MQVNHVKVSCWSTTPATKHGFQEWIQAKVSEESRRHDNAKETQPMSSGNDRKHVRNNWRMTKMVVSNKSECFWTTRIAGAEEEQSDSAPRCNAHLEWWQNQQLVPTHCTVVMTTSSKMHKTVKSATRSGEKRSRPPH